MVPVLAWLLWRHPPSRLPFVGIAGISILGALATGWGAEWITQLARSDADINSVVNISPSRFIGLSWLLLGIPLSIWLTWRGRLGWASLAISPYLLPPYLLMAMLERNPADKGRRTGPTDSSGNVPP